MQAFLKGVRLGVSQFTCQVRVQDEALGGMVWHLNVRGNTTGTGDLGDFFHMPRISKYDITIYHLYRKTAKIHCHIYHIILSCRMKGVSEENAKMFMFFYIIAFEFYIDPYFGGQDVWEPQLLRRLRPGRNRFCCFGSFLVCAAQRSCLYEPLRSAALQKPDGYDVSTRILPGTNEINEA